MVQIVLRSNILMQLSSYVLLGGLLVGLTGCGTSLIGGAEAQSRQGQGQRGGDDGPAAVDVAIARTGPIAQEQEYTGTTQPYRDVAVRSRIEGQLLSLSVDVGDAVVAGETLGRLDDAVLTAAVVEAEAELAAQEADVVRAQTEVSTAETSVEDARLKLQQAQSDQARLEELFRAGASAEQQVETARTATGTARQAVRTAEKNVQTRRQLVAVAQRRTISQRAIVAQERERRSYTEISSPVNGFVTERTLEPGNLAQPGSEVLTIGDFSQVKVAVQVSEREVGSIRPGQTAQVQLDAFPNQRLVGRVSRVSPAADPTARLIPVEVIIPNLNGRVGSGLLARVSFSQQTVQQVVIPEAALETNQTRGARRPGGAGAANQGNGNPQNPTNQAGNSGQGNSGQGNPGQGNARQGNSGQGNPGQRSRSSNASAGTIFVLTTQTETPTVQARQVSLGKRQDGQVEVLSGLRAGDRYVVRSSKALKTGDAVKLSVLSEGSPPRQKDQT